MKNMVKNGSSSSSSSSSEFEVGVGAVLDANSSEGIQGLRDPREQAINASASDLNEYSPYAKADRISADSYNGLVAQDCSFKMTTFDPRHAIAIPDFDNGGSGGGGGDSSAAKGQLPEKDTGGMRHWWKKVRRFLRKKAPRH